MLTKHSAYGIILLQNFLDTREKGRLLMIDKKELIKKINTDSHIHTDYGAGNGASVAIHQHSLHR